jgi:hypothetical protein
VSTFGDSDSKYRVFVDGKLSSLTEQLNQLFAGFSQDLETHVEGFGRDFVFAMALLNGEDVFSGRFYSIRAKALLDEGLGEEQEVAPRVAIVIDSEGAGKKAIDSFLSLPVPLTFVDLENREVRRRARFRGMKLMSANDFKKATSGSGLNPVDIDYVMNRGYIDQAISHAFEQAQEEGFAVLRTKPYSEVVRVLRRRLSDLSGEGVRAVTITSAKRSENRSY